MGRGLYHDQKVRNLLFANTLLYPKNGIRDHAILRVLYGTTLRPIEMINIKTHDLVNDEGSIKTGDGGVLRQVISFNNKTRPFPLNDPQLIDALQKWIDFRIQYQWGTNGNGSINLNTHFFLQGKDKAFQSKVTVQNGKNKYSTESINRIIRKIYEINNVEGSVDSGLRTWTLEANKRCIGMPIILELRGDIATIKRVISKDPVRLGAAVEKVF
jgi:integrase